FPGLLQAIRHIATDESRHIRYGLFLLNRLVSEDDAIWDRIKAKMNELFPLALALLPEFFDNYDEDNPPVGPTLTAAVEAAAGAAPRPPPSPVTEWRSSSVASLSEWPTSRPATSRASCRRSWCWAPPRPTGGCACCGPTATPSSAATSANHSSPRPGGGWVGG